MPGRAPAMDATGLEVAELAGDCFDSLVVLAYLARSSSLDCPSWEEDEVGEVESAEERSPKMRARAAL